MTFLESSSRSNFLFEHDLFGKPLHTFPDLWSQTGALPAGMNPHIASWQGPVSHVVAPCPDALLHGCLMAFHVTGRCKIFAAAAALLVLTSPADAQERRLYTPPPLDSVHAVPSEHGMVVAQEKIATQVGADILRRGGNAVDAAVATGFALAVTYPRAGNIGGGGFMVIHSAERGQDIAIDYRETGPAAMTRDVFLGPDGKPDNARSRDSALGIGVPGTVAGLALALEKFGSGNFTLAEILKPAIDLARDGFVVTDDTADTLSDMYRRMSRWPNSAKGFSRTDGSPLRDGDTLVQGD